MKQPLLIFLILSFSPLLINNITATERVFYEIMAPQDSLQKWSNGPLDLAGKGPDGNHQFILTDAQVSDLRHEGWQLTSVEPAGMMQVSTQWHYLDEIYQAVQEVVIDHPEIAKVETIGYSQWWQNPILAVKISDNVHLDEDEPVFYFDGQIHAREPLGMEICLAVIQHLVDEYNSNLNIKHLVDNLEIWLVPIVNPDGWKYTYETATIYPWWRKNLRDNNSDDIFSVDYDGVDLNRNFDYQWNNAGDSYSDSWLYHGSNPFSEAETQALRDLLTRIRPVFAITYHSYGEEMYYPYYPESDTASNYLINRDFAYWLSQEIDRLDGAGKYAAYATTSTGMTQGWVFDAFGTVSVLVETGTSFIPPDEEIDPVVQEHLHAAIWALERMTYKAFAGHVSNARTGTPVPASIVAIDNEGNEFHEIIADEIYGYYHRPVMRDYTYALIFSHPDYETMILEDCQANLESVTTFDVEMTLHPAGVEISSPHNCRISLSNRGVYLAGEFKENTRITFYDLKGRMLNKEQIPAGMFEFLWQNTPGVYFVRITDENHESTVKVLILN